MQSYKSKCKNKDCSTLVFWGLLLAGLVVWGACMVVPVWMNYRMLAQQSHQLSERVKEFAHLVRADQEAIAAAGHNVAFNERLLMEELNYHRPGEQVLLVKPVALEEALQAPAYSQTGGPAWLRGFVQPDSRSILLVMSAGLVFFALVYYPADTGPSNLHNT